MESASRHEEAGASDASTILKHGNACEEMPLPENNGEHDETSAQVESNQNIFDGEQQDDAAGAADDLNLDHEDAECPSNASSPLDGENSEDIPNDAFPPDDSESANEIDNSGGVLPPDKYAEFNAADDGDAEGANGNDDYAAADAETEERSSMERPDLPDEPSNEVTDADVVDAPSPYAEFNTSADGDAEGANGNDDNAAADAETEEKSSVECPDLPDEPSNEFTDADVVDAPSPYAEFNASADGDAEGANGNDDNAAADAETEERDSVERPDLPDEPSNEVTDADVVDAPSPMDVDVSPPPDANQTASDAGGCDGEMEVEYPTGGDDAGGSAADQLAAEPVSSEKDQESPMAEDNDDISRQPDPSTAEHIGELQDSENVTTGQQSPESETTGCDEVDASASKSSLQNEVPVSDVDESRNVDDGLVEGADYTVELQPDTSEQESGACEVDQPVEEGEAAENTEQLGTEESGNMSDQVKTTASDVSSALPPVSSDAVRKSSCHQSSKIMHRQILYCIFNRGYWH